MPTLREESRFPFTTIGARGTHEEVQTGCLQRIADATELMARNHQKLIDDREYWEAEARLWERRVKERDRQISALRGVITKLRKAAAK